MWFWEHSLQAIKMWGMAQWNTGTSKAICQWCAINSTVKGITINVDLLWRSVYSCGCRIHKLSWIGVGSTSIAGCLCFSRPKMVFWAGFGIFGTVYRICFFHIFLTPPSHSCYAAFFTLSQICSLRGATSITDWPSSGQQQVWFGVVWNGDTLVPSPKGHSLLPKPCCLTQLTPQVFLVVLQLIANCYHPPLSYLVLSLSILIKLKY